MWDISEVSAATIFRIISEITFLAVKSRSVFCLFDKGSWTGEKWRIFEKMALEKKLWRWECVSSTRCPIGGVEPLGYKINTCSLMAILQRHVSRRIGKFYCWRRSTQVHTQKSNASLWSPACSMFQLTAWFIRYKRWKSPTFCCWLSQPLLRSLPPTRFDV